MCHCARGGSRTHTSFRTKDFKSFAYTIPPPGQIALKTKGTKPMNIKQFTCSQSSAKTTVGFLEAWAGIEPAHKSFADSRLTTCLPGHIFSLRFLFYYVNTVLENLVKSLTRFLAFVYFKIDKGYSFCFYFRSEVCPQFSPFSF